jgi:hypothetical protein
MKYTRLLALVLLAASISGCGGGGGGGSTAAATGPVTSTLTFPARSAIDALTANGESYTLRATGTSATDLAPEKRTA